MNKTIKILSMVLMVIMLVTAVTPVFAAPDIISSINTDGSVDADKAGGLVKSAGQVVSLIRTIAVIAGVVILTILGLKYMMGSPEEKSEYKKSLIPLAVGVVVVMASAQIATMMFNIVTTG